MRSIFTTLFSVFLILNLSADQSKKKNLSDVSVLEVSTTRSVEEIIELIRDKPDASKINWNEDVLGYWKSGDRAFFMINSKIASGMPRMTNVQWLTVVLADLQFSNVLKVNSCTKVTLGSVDK